MSAADLGLENIRKDKPVTHHGVSNVNGDGMTKHRPCIGKSVAPPLWPQGSASGGRSASKDASNSRPAKLSGTCFGSTQVRQGPLTSLHLLPTDPSAGPQRNDRCEPCSCKLRFPVPTHLF